MTPTEASLANLEPFTDGNGAALTHGAYSAGTVAPIADKLVAELTDLAPWAARPVFAAAVHAWAWAEAQAHLLRAWLDQVGPLDDEGEVRGFMEELHRAESRAASRRAELGLNPKAWAALVRDMAQAGGDQDALDALKAEGRRILDGSGGAS